MWRNRSQIFCLSLPSIDADFMRKIRTENFSSTFTTSPTSMGTGLSSPEMPEEVRNLVTFKELGRQDGSKRSGILLAGVGHMMEMSKMGMEQCLDKMAAIFAKP